MNGSTVRVAIANGTGNAAKLLDMVKNGEAHYDFIEVMGCPGGCVTGGGQPIINATKLSYIDPKTLRAEGLYREDAGKKLRKSHENPGVRRVYEEYFEQPGSHRAHELLHTHYTKRNKF